MDAVELLFRALPSLSTIAYQIFGTPTEAKRMTATATHSCVLLRRLTVGISVHQGTWVFPHQLLHGTTGGAAGGTD